MAFFRRIISPFIALFNKVFKFQASVHTNVPDPDDPEQMPAIVPAAPLPIKVPVSLRIKPRRPVDPWRELEVTRAGDIVAIECGTRRKYRAVTHAIDRVCSAQKRGLYHRRQVRERNVIVLAEDLSTIYCAMTGTLSFKELRAIAA